MPDAVDAQASPLRGCTNLRLHQLMRRMDQLYDAELAPAGLRTTQYSLLSYVVRRGPIAPVELARGLKMQASTLSRNLRPLEQAGWIRIGPGADARSRAVSATPAGEAKRAEALQLWKQAQQRLNGRLGPARVAALHTLLDDCLRELEPAPAVPARRLSDTPPPSIPTPETPR